MDQNTTKKIHIFRNGDGQYAGKKFVCNYRSSKTWTAFLDNVAREIEAVGPVRGICTPVNGTPVTNLDDICDRSNYVALGKAPFKPLNYESLQELANHKFNFSPRKPVSNNDSVAKYRDRYKEMAVGRIRDIQTDSIIIFVYMNGESQDSPFRTIIQRKSLDSYESVLREINHRIKLRGKSAKTIYTTDGKKIMKGGEFENNQSYVAVSPSDFRGFMKADYGAFAKPKFYVPLKNNEKMPINQWKSSDYINIRVQHQFRGKANSYAGGSAASGLDTDSEQPGRNSLPGVKDFNNKKKLSYSQQKEREDMFHAKTLKPSKQTVREIDLDKDEGGLFKVRRNRDETRGAAQVHEAKSLTRKQQQDIQEEIDGDYDESSLKGKKPQKDNKNSKTSKAISDGKKDGGYAAAKQRRDAESDDDGSPIRSKKIIDGGSRSDDEQETGSSGNGFKAVNGIGMYGQNKVKRKSRGHIDHDEEDKVAGDGQKSPKKAVKENLVKKPVGGSKENENKKFEENKTRKMEAGGDRREDSSDDDESIKSKAKVVDKKVKLDGRDSPNSSDEDTKKRGEGIKKFGIKKERKSGESEDDASVDREAGGRKKTKTGKRNGDDSDEEEKSSKIAGQKIKNAGNAGEQAANRIKDGDKLLKSNNEKRSGRANKKAGNNNSNTESEDDENNGAKIKSKMGQPIKAGGGKLGHPIKADSDSDTKKRNSNDESDDERKSGKGKIVEKANFDDKSKKQIKSSNHHPVEPEIRDRRSGRAKLAPQDGDSDDDDDEKPKKKKVPTATLR